MILKVQAGVRYWEDAYVNGIEDTDGTLIPFKTGNMWIVSIDVIRGLIVDWPKNTKADIHYKVCDDGMYTLYSYDGSVISNLEEGSYVPRCLSVGRNGYGDYIIMKIDQNGKIIDWPVKVDLREFGL